MKRLPDLFLVVLSLLLLNACKKEDDQAGSCRLIKRSFSAIKTIQVYEYNAKGQLVKVNSNWGMGNEYVMRYNDQNQLLTTTLTMTGQGIQVMYTYEYDQQNRWIHSEERQKVNDKPFQTTAYLTPTYDSAGNCVQVRFEYNGRSYNQKEEYVYQLGNLIESRYTNSNGDLVTATYEYDMDQLNPFQEFESQFQLVYLQTSSLATPSRNLIKKIVRSSGQVITYTYEFNDRGLPIKRICTSRNDPDVVYEYRCP